MLTSTWSPCRTMSTGMSAATSDEACNSITKEIRRKRFLRWKESTGRGLVGATLVVACGRPQGPPLQMRLLRKSKLKLVAHFEDRLLTFSNQAHVFRNRRDQHGMAIVESQCKTSAWAFCRTSKSLNLLAACRPSIAAFLLHNSCFWIAVSTAIHLFPARLPRPARWSRVPACRQSPIG